MRGIVLSSRAERDLRRIGPGPEVARIRVALVALVDDGADLDIKPLAGAVPWRRLRVGDYRVLYRPIEPAESVEGGARWLVARVIHRRELERAVATLS